MRTVAVAVAVLLAGSAPAVAAPTDGRVYAFTLRAAAVEPYARAGRDLPVGLGFSSVDLRRGPTVPAGRCDAVGAGYWLGVYEDRGPVFDPERTYRGEGPTGPNPTAARVTRPAGAGGDRTPAFGGDSPAGARWTAGCDEDGGAGRASAVGLGGPILVAGATATASVAESIYLGAARSYVQELGPSTGALSSLASSFRVVANLGDEPVISYEITWVRADPGNGLPTEAGPRSVRLAGNLVPAGELVGQFARQAERYAVEIGDLAAVGVTLLSPRVTQADGGTSISAAAFDIGAGLAQRRSLAGQAQGIRLGSVTFACLCRLPWLPGRNLDFTR